MEGRRDFPNWKSKKERRGTYAHVRPPAITNLEKKMEKSPKICQSMGRRPLGGKKYFSFLLRPGRSHYDASIPQLGLSPSSSAAHICIFALLFRFLLGEWRGTEMDALDTGNWGRAERSTMFFGACGRMDGLGRDTHADFSTNVLKRKEVGEGKKELFGEQKEEYFRA